MGLNTNSWDYGFHINLDQVKAIIDKNISADATLINTVTAKFAVTAISSVADITARAGC